jgi:hypothetical protein
LPKSRQKEKLKKIKIKKRKIRKQSDLVRFSIARIEKE